MWYSLKVGQVMSKKVRGVQWEGVMNEGECGRGSWEGKRRRRRKEVRSG